MEEEIFSRTKTLFKEENFNKLKNKKVIVFGVGGVGGYVVEGLVRSGISSITLVDNDKITPSNINRQIIALHSTIGKDKVDVIKERILDINPEIEVETYKMFFLKENSDEINFKNYDYIIDAIDTVKAKLALVECAYKNNIPIISSMGTGNKINPTEFLVSDISKTSVCPLARVMRTELKKRGIKNLKVVYSKEQPAKTGSRTPSSCSFVPPVAGFIIASEVIKDLIK